MATYLKICNVCNVLNHNPCNMICIATDSCKNCKGTATLSCISEG